MPQTREIDRLMMLANLTEGLARLVGRKPNQAKKSTESMLLATMADQPEIVDKPRCGPYSLSSYLATP